MASGRLFHWFIWPSMKLFTALHQMRVPKEQWTQSDVTALVFKSFLFSVLLAIVLVSFLIKYLLRYYSIPG